MTKRLQFWLPATLYAAVILYICTFKVGNSDFWWHIKAGQILRESGWIALDPFAYTRVGEAYLANHEWLAQVILSLFYDLHAVWGVTVLRMTLVLTTFGMPLLLYRKHLWITGALAALATIGSRPSLSDRPQLWTFLFFSWTVCLCIAYLESDAGRRKKILILLPLGLMVWSNLHGAASIIGIAVFAALVVQRLISGALADHQESQWLTYAGVALLFAPIVAPSGVGNVTYLSGLLSDESAGLIFEWQWVPWTTYFLHTLPLWISSIVALILSKRNWVFCGLILVAMGYLSRTAGRHETLFLIAALAVTVYQLRHTPLEIGISKRMKMILGTLGTLVLLGFVHVRSYDINRTDHLFGIGMFEPVRGAYAFVEREGIEGNMFNNYNAGGELLFRGYPDRKVFLDGRNLDYGYTYVNHAINAGIEYDVWQALEEEYDFSHAVIYYDLQAELNPLPYTDLLDADSEWSLVYLDDWTAVYEKAESRKQKAEITITSITPKTLHQQLIPEALTVPQYNALQRDLNRMIRERPDGVKPRVYLAKLYTMLEAYSEAEVLLRDALRQQPKNFQIYLGLMDLYREQGNYDAALRMLNKAKRRAGFSGVEINKELSDSLKRKAGR